MRQAPAFRARLPQRILSECGDLVRLQALGALPGGGFHPLVLFQDAVAAHVDRRVMHEDVGAAVVGCYKTEALIGVEPLHGSLCHLLVSFQDVFPPPLAPLLAIPASEVPRAVISTVCGAPGSRRT